MKIVSKNSMNKFKKKINFCLIKFSNQNFSTQKSNSCVFLVSTKGILFSTSKDKALTALQLL